MTAVMSDLNGSNPGLSSMAKRCSIDGCDRPMRYPGRGWCTTHYNRYLRTGSALTATPVRRYGRRKCSVTGCQRKHQGAGWCNAHHLRVMRTGDPGPAQIGVSRAPKKRWPAVALLDELGSHAALARFLGRQRMAAEKWDRVLLTNAQADDAAMRLGLHPAEIWPAWLVGGWVAA